MSPAQILALVISTIQQFGLVPYIQAGLLVIVAISTIAAVRRALSNS